jgi:hypothetical protein
MSGLNPFCHSQLPRNLTVNGLWYAYLGVTLSALIGGIGSSSMFQDFLQLQMFVNFGFHCWLQ